MKSSKAKRILAMLLAVVLTAGICSVSECSKPVEASSGAALITSAQISGSNVVVNATASSLPSGGDGTFYLFALKMNQGKPTGKPVATASAATNAHFSFPLNKGTASSHLYDKFAVCTKNGGSYTVISNYHYITNPEGAATNSSQRISEANKKGIWGEDLTGLGVAQTGYNLNLHEFTIVQQEGGNWKYNGKTWNVGGNIAGYDYMVQKYNSLGISITMTVLNGWGDMDFIHPKARKKGTLSPYYMMNTAETAGLEKIEALMAFFANRYNGSTGHGQINNWIIGNEINARDRWNYYPFTDVATYAALYADNLRICYNAIKSESKNAYVLTSIDQMWDRDRNGDHTYYDGRDFMDAMNSYIVTQGNFDWGVTQHPYNTPLYYTPFWTPMDGYYAKLISHDASTDMITIENIEVLTDYLTQPSYLGTKGQVRPLYLTEVGYSSALYGDPNSQAAALIYSYNRVIRNSHINGMLVKNLNEDPNEVAQKLYFGLIDSAGKPKTAYNYFKDMGSAGAVSFAQGIIGADRWNTDMSIYSR